MESINPHSGEMIRSYEPHTEEQVDDFLHAADDAFRGWRKSPFADRAGLMKAAARILRERKSALARLMADEMGKVISDGIAEVEKCAGCCDY